MAFEVEDADTEWREVEDRIVATSSRRHIRSLPGPVVPRRSGALSAVHDIPFPRLVPTNQRAQAPTSVSRVFPGPSSIGGAVCL